jgi:spermidine synthase
VLELLVAFFGCTIVFGLPVVGDLMRPMWQMLWDYQPALLGLRFVVSFLILLLPTTAMGLTLPVIIKDPLLRETEFGRAIGFLYGSNTLGAMFGAVLGEAYLIGAFGLYGTGLAAGAAICIAAVIALAAARFGAARYVSDFEGADPSGHSKFPLSFDASYRPPWRLLFASFGSGLVLLSLELIWFRFLRLYVVSSPTAFAVMLAVVLAGIGLGSIAAGAINHRSARLHQLVPVLFLLAAVALLLSYLFFPGEAVRTSAGAFNLASWWQIAVLCMALMFPVSFLSGMLFPTIVSRIQVEVTDRMNSTGIATLLNTSGAAIGPLLATFVLLPFLGYQTSLICCAAAYGLLSVIVTERALCSLRRPTGIILAALWIALVLGLVFFPYQRREAHFEHASRPYEKDNEGHLLARVVKRIEGTSDTWQLLRRDLFGQPYYYRLLTDSFSMSATSPRNQRYMRLFAYLPLALHPAARDVLLICFGCGVTADAFTQNSSLERIDIVDISKEVFSLAGSYVGTNYSNPLRDPRVHPIVQDGRFFLQASARKYDIISGEPPPPKNAGAVNLYTREFFALMKSRLREDGIATFWLPIDQLKLQEAKAILRAFHDVFSNASVWASADDNWIMLGINGPGHKRNEEELRQLWSDPGTGADLRRIGVEVPSQLGALFLMDGEEIDRITREVPPLTDNYPKRLSDAQWDRQENFDVAAAYMEPASVSERFLASPLIKRIWPETLNKSMESLFAIRQTRYVSEAVGSNKLAELDLFLRGTRLRMPVLEALGSDDLRFAIAQRVARETDPPSSDIVPDLVAGALAQRDLAEAIRLLESQKDRGALDVHEIILLTYLYCLNANVDKAEALAAANSAMINKDSSADWLWKKLETDFGFHPPAG